MKTISRHLSYANVVATLALVFAMSGGALAALHYLIHSTKQISPKVLRKLKGNRGARGPRGLSGAAGAAGSPGAAGTKGSDGAPGQSALTPLPSGQSVSGDFQVANGENSDKYLATAVTFPIGLKAPIPFENVVYTVDPTHLPHCSGPGHADPGFLCIYANASFNVTLIKTFGTEDEPFGEAVSAGRFGFGMSWAVTTPGKDAEADGTYTVTAP